ncbi:Ala-tRNA(Pro) hydrolase [Thioclava dalianensis]|uniref:Ala-tRNA(Pro) hydrolase n=1 Tax=Thioclava dalianensis TaxID=1185766 RepID=A0A074TIM1_9RHOB|nr:alanyl-tRNA editing protein [Thioclava dalianensis]KEP71499.1 Ala-tRNA(Pro) hydrolase [Thioclava dalianensis]SFN64435.1 misacylated tRNA(Ala) deacylase [Thioclava dalianensis]
MGDVPAFRANPYLRRVETEVTGHTAEGGICCADSIFYPTGGGQPGDSGRLHWSGGSLGIATAIKPGPDAPGPAILVPSEPQPMPRVGTIVTQEIDWERRHRHMRMHTALHLLSVALPFPVSGGQIGPERGRLDFDMPEKPENPDAITAQINDWIAQDLPVNEYWITQDELRAHPELIKTMSVSPPAGSGPVRLIAIGEAAARIDLQPCGGTHVARLSEIGAVRLGKIDSKGRQNRRVYLHLV